MVQRIGYPLGKFRLGLTIIVAFTFGFLLFYFSVNTLLFTAIRQIYLIYGIIVGFLFGLFEAQTITCKLSKVTEVVTWRILVVSAALFGAPFLLVLAFFGISELVPLVTYLVLSATPVYLGVSGWIYYRFEKEYKVKVHAFVFGLEYWKEPLKGNSDRFYYFVRDIVSKDVNVLWWQVGYAKRFMEELEKNANIDPLTRHQLSEFLKVINKYRIITQSVLLLFVVSTMAIAVSVFAVLFGLIGNLDFNLLDVVGPISGVILASFFISVIVTKRQFNKEIPRMMTSLNTENLASIQ